MRFPSRERAGERLGRYLAERNVGADLVVGLPRGGVVVAAGVAQALGLSMVVLVVRKIGHPWNREFAVGALAEGGTILLEEVHAEVDPADLAAIVAEETRRLQEYQAKFHPEGPLDLKQKRVLVVDDGLATGSTMEAAVRACHQLQASQVDVGVPVASAGGVARLAKMADHVFALRIDPKFVAVGQYYWTFPQTTDEEVLCWLGASRSQLHHRWQARV